MSLDRMTIRATYNTLRDLSLRLIDAFCIADVKRLAAPNVIEVKSHRELSIATVKTAMLDFVSIKPPANGCRPIVGLPVDAFSISWISKTALTPYLCFVGFVDAVARAAISLANFVGISLSPSTTGFSEGFGVSFSPAVRGFATTVAVIIGSHEGSLP